MIEKQSVEEATIRNILNCCGADEETIKGACDYMQEVVTGYRNILYDALDAVNQLSAGIDLQWLMIHNAIDINNETERQFDYLIDSQSVLLERVKNTLKSQIGDDVTGKEKRCY